MPSPTHASSIKIKVLLGVPSAFDLVCPIRWTIYDYHPTNGNGCKTEMATSLHSGDEFEEFNLNSKFLQNFVEKLVDEADYFHKKIQANLICQNSKINFSKFRPCFSTVSAQKCEKLWRFFSTDFH